MLVALFMHLNMINFFLIREHAREAIPYTMLSYEKMVPPQDVGVFTVDASYGVNDVDRNRILPLSNFVSCFFC
jgi:hypothetical protein